MRCSLPLRSGILLVAVAVCATANSPTSVGSTSTRFLRPCALAMAHLPAASVSAVRARIEVPAIYEVVGSPVLAIAADPRLMHSVGVSVGSDGQHFIDVALLFPEPTALSPHLVEFSLRMPDADRLPEPLIIRFFSALGANGRALRDARAEVLVYSASPAATPLTP